MSAMLDHVVAQIVALQVRLLACRERLAADTDSEALHDLRTTLRRLRSLLRPLRGLPGWSSWRRPPGRWVPSPRRCATVRCWRPN